MKHQQFFTEKAFEFLNALRLNNDRDWFQAHKTDYEQHVKAPMITFIGSFSTPLEEISPHFVADTRPNGGSMFRIYRDMRFSSNKEPYKTHAASQFRHEMGKDVHAPGFYFHISPGENIFGAGIWRPTGPALQKIRQAIAEEQDEWLAITRDPAFTAECPLTGESLKRAPRGFASEHPLIEDLKRKDIIVSRPVEREVITGDHLLDTYTQWCRVASPLVRFLCKALELPY
jgi:uncharacterized protein (TIGR02453 family)